MFSNSSRTEWYSRTVNGQPLERRDQAAGVKHGWAEVAGNGPRMRDGFVQQLRDLLAGGLRLGVLVAGKYFDAQLGGDEQLLVFIMQRLGEPAAFALFGECELRSQCPQLGGLLGQFHRTFLDPLLQEHPLGSKLFDQAFPLGDVVPGQDGPAQLAVDPERCP